MDTPPDTLTECKACGGGELRAQCAYCGGTGAMTKAQLFLWRANEQRRRSISSSYSLIESLVRDAVACLTESGRDDVSEVIEEASVLLEQWRATDSMSSERESLARQLRVLHRKLLDSLTTPTSSP